MDRLWARPALAGASRGYSVRLGGNGITLKAWSSRQVTMRQKCKEKNSQRREKMLLCRRARLLLVFVRRRGGGGGTRKIRQR